MRIHVLPILLILFVASLSAPGFAQDSTPLIDLNGYFPMTVPDSLEQWKQRKQELKKQVQVAVGLWPMPAKTPLNAVIHSPVEREGIVIERVYFESQPGLYVTGQLFRPAVYKGPRPVVLSPHGHGGRMYDVGEKRVREQIVQGQERFESSGRMPKIARCVQLARMGCMVLLFDMMGYGDNHQLSHDLTHRYAKQRPELNSPERYGLFSAQAEMRIQTVMGLQVWNSIRALDFLLEHPLADPNKVGVTGGSGGGTQSILLCALDDRPHVAFPQGMVSTSMQGGCTCENTSLLRIGSGNVELAALFAPKPQAMTAANDWTIDMMTKGYPELKALYELYGKGTSKNVLCTDATLYPHNFNYPTRALMYDWFNRHLKLGHEWPIVEEDYELMSIEEMQVWNEQHPAPKSDDLEFEIELLRSMDRGNAEFLSQLSPKGGRDSELGAHVLPALKTIVGPHSHSASESWRTDKPVRIQLRATSDDEQTDPNLIPIAMQSGVEVKVEEQTYHWNPVVSNPRQAPCYTYCYNNAVIVQRVHQVLTTIKQLQASGVRPQNITLEATSEFAPVAVLAACLLEEPIAHLKIDLNGFRFQQITHYRDINFLVGAIKYGDIPVMLGLANVSMLTVSDTMPLPELTQQLFEGQKERIVVWHQRK